MVVIVVMVMVVMMKQMLTTGLENYVMLAGNHEFGVVEGDNDGKVLLLRCMVMIGACVSSLNNLLEIVRPQDVLYDAVLDGT